MSGLKPNLFAVVQAAQAKEREEIKQSDAEELNAELEEGGDTVETAELNLPSSSSFISKLPGRINPDTSYSLDRLLQQRMNREKFESRFINTTISSRGIKLGALLAQRPNKVKLYQLNYIKQGGGAHDNLTAAQSRLLSEQKRNRLNSLIHHRPNSIDLTKRNILKEVENPASLTLSNQSNLQTTRLVLDGLLATRPTVEKVKQLKIIADIGDTPGHQVEHREGNQITPRLVTSLLNIKVISVVCGFAHTMILDEEGKVWAFGNSSGGRLGLGVDQTRTGDEKDISAFPTVISSLSSIGKVTSISAGDNHTAAIMNDGSLYTWGVGQWGRLGLQHQEDVNTPTKVSMPNNEKVSTISCGACHTILSTSSNNVYSFGWNKLGRLGIPKSNSNSLTIATPTIINTLSPPHINSPIAQFSAGTSHTLALTYSGLVYSFGCGSFGELGHGNFADVYEPKLIEKLSNVQITSIAVGASHSVCSSINAVYTFGVNKSDELGRKVDEKDNEKYNQADAKSMSIDPPNLSACSIPTPIHLPNNIGDCQFVVAGKSHSLLVASSKIYSWGLNSRSVLGRSSTSNSNTNNSNSNSSGIGMVDSLNDIPILSAAASWGHSAAVSDKGELYTWGSKMDYKLGY